VAGDGLQPSPSPLSTLVIDVSGSALLGILAGFLTRGAVSPTTSAWVGTGFLGGYTTFLTFTYEAVRLIEDGAWRYVALNVLLSGPLCFVAAAVTYLPARTL
jgi:CrcB protein